MRGVFDDAQLAGQTTGPAGRDGKRPGGQLWGDDRLRRSALHRRAQLRRHLQPDPDGRWIASCGTRSKRCAGASRHQNRSNGSKRSGKASSTGYIQAETTLNDYRKSYWFPRLFDRLSWHSYQQADGKTADQRAREELLSRLAGYSYHPAEAAIQDVRRIFNQAWTRLGGDPKADYLSALYND